MWPAHAVAGSLWLPLVPCRRPRLSVEAQRYRYGCGREDESPGLVRRPCVRSDDSVVPRRCYPTITPSLPRTSSAPSIGSLSRSRKVDSRILLATAVAAHANAGNILFEGIAPLFGRDRYLMHADLVAVIERRRAAQGEQQHRRDAGLLAADAARNPGPVVIAEHPVRPGAGR